MSYIFSLSLPIGEWLKPNKISVENFLFVTLSVLCFSTRVVTINRRKVSSIQES